MSTSVLYMSMSLDGFITGPDDDADHGLGVSGERLHDWLGDPDGARPAFRPPGASRRPRRPPVSDRPSRPVTTGPPPWRRSSIPPAAG